MVCVCSVAAKFKGTKSKKKNCDDWHNSHMFDFLQEFSHHVESPIKGVFGADYKY
jgi:hypothetical protein